MNVLDVLYSSIVALAKSYSTSVAQHAKSPDTWPILFAVADKIGRFQRSVAITHTFVSDGVAGNTKVHRAGNILTMWVQHRLSRFMVFMPEYPELPKCS